MLVRTVDIEIWDEEDEWAQGRYLVHGHDDVFWTDSMDYALAFLKNSLGKEHD